ncbi:hypothetical protein [Paraburkholderia caffeinilytica]|uniref:hypothetical protein n=1 Tax=Paraburkholderia caffeinilytica TaxID=1761016 RepID=UPI003DA1BE37
MNERTWSGPGCEPAWITGKERDPFRIEYRHVRFVALSSAEFHFQFPALVLLTDFHAPFRHTQVRPKAGYT